jgi:AcrR family transcriptional regulator
MSSESIPHSAPVPARDRILSVAGGLFYRDGYRATGVDRVIAEADVAKATFYRHFPSKDDLIVAWIARAEAQSAAGLPPMDGPEPLYAWGDRMIDIAGRPTCLGCTYQGAAAEFVEPSHPAHAAALGVKRRVMAELAERARNQGIAAPDTVAAQVFILIEGVWAIARMFGPDAPLTHAKAALRAVVKGSGVAMPDDVT